MDAWPTFSWRGFFIVLDLVVMVVSAWLQVGNSYQCMDADEEKQEEWVSTNLYIPTGQYMLRDGEGENLSNKGFGSVITDNLTKNMIFRKHSEVKNTRVKEKNEEENEEITVFKEILIKSALDSAKNDDFKLVFGLCDKLPDRFLKGLQEWADCKEDNEISVQCSAAAQAILNNNANENNNFRYYGILCTKDISSIDKNINAIDLLSDLRLLVGIVEFNVSDYLEEIEIGHSGIDPEIGRSTVDLEALNYEDFKSEYINIIGQIKFFCLKWILARKKGYCVKDWVTFLLDYDINERLNLTKA